MVVHCNGVDLLVYKLCEFPTFFFWIKNPASSGMLVVRVHFVPYGGYLVFAVLQLNRYVAFAQGIFGNTMYLEVLRKIGQFLLHHYIQKN